MAIGLLYLFAAIVAVVMWMTGFSIICAEQVCTQLGVGFWGRPWLLWGALYYSLAGMLTMKYRKNLIVGVLLFSGVLFHALLLIFSYYYAHLYCPVCLSFFVFELLVATAYLLVKSKENSISIAIAMGPIRACAIVIIALLAVNQVPASSNTHLPKAYAANISSGSTLNITTNMTNENMAVTQDIQTSQTFTAPEPNEALTTGEENTNESLPEILNVVGQDGGTVALNIKERPALMFAWWCAHCDDVLQDISRITPDKRPYLVVTYLQGTNDDIYIEQKLKSNGLASSPYFVLKEDPEKIEGVPVLVWYDKGFQQSYDLDYETIDEMMTKYVRLQPRWSYNAYETAQGLVQTPVSIKYQPINNPAAILTWLKNKNSLLAENEYLVDLDNAGKKYDVDPLLLLAITGQEQSFVPANWSNTEQMIKNPFNVYGSWQLYAPGFAKSAMIAAQTVNRLSADCPLGMDPIHWINSPDNPNCRYAEDTQWWRGVKKFYEELKSLV